MCADGLNVRVAPMGDIKDQATRGQVLEVYAPEDGWSEIAEGEWRGLWVNALYLCP